MNALRPQTNTELATGVRAVAGTMMMLAAAFLAGAMLVPIYGPWIVVRMGVLILIWQLLLRSRVLDGAGMLRQFVVVLLAWLSYSVAVAAFVSLEEGSLYIPLPWAAILSALATLVLLLPVAIAVWMLVAARSVSDRRWVGLAGAAILLMAVHLTWHPFWDRQHEFYEWYHGLHDLVALHAMAAPLGALGGSGLRLVRGGPELRVAGAVALAGLILGSFANASLDPVVELFVEGP